MKKLTAEQFNEKYPIGTKVLYWSFTRDEDGVESQTRAPAWTLGHGEPVVSVNGKAGGIALSHIEILPGQETEPRGRRMIVETPSSELLTPDGKTAYFITRKEPEEKP